MRVSFVERYNALSKGKRTFFVDAETNGVTGLGFMVRRD
jgi:hypothetical protein